MKNLASIVISLIAFGVAVFAVFQAVQPPTEEPTEPTYGAVSGPSIDGNYFNVGGVQLYYGKAPIIATSSVLCAVKSPPATSTLELFKMNTRQNYLLGTNVIYVSTTTQAIGYGSSTPSLIANITLATSTVYIWTPGMATTTDPVRVLPTFRANGASTIVLAPNTYITARVATETPMTVAATSITTGSCDGTFQVLN